MGELFEGTALKDLLFEAIQYGEQEEVKARLFRAVDGAVDQNHLLQLLERRALTNDTMPQAKVHELRLEMEKAEAQRLQPHHVQSFFVEAFQRLGGQIKRREEGRWEITHVPVILRERDRQIGVGAPVQKKYERICFEKDRINQQPVAAFVCPGHPLLEAVISVIREQYDQPLAAALHSCLAPHHIQVAACPGGQVRGNDNDVRVFDVQHIKGLEFEAVFFIGIDELAAAKPDLFEKFLYVGATRAAMYLGLTTTGDALPERVAPLVENFGTDWT